MTAPARVPGTQQVPYLRRAVAFNTPLVGTADTIEVGTLPANCILVRAYVRIKTAFNAGTTNVLTVGTSSGSNADIVAAGDVDETATGTTQVTRGAGLSLTSDTPIYAKYTQTGTAATTGAAEIVIEYIPDNDR